MSLLAVFGITNDALNLAVNLLLLFLVVLWLALVFWTYMDAHRRIADPMLVACATAASLFPFIGTIVYMIVRPPEYLEDVRERELEIRAMEERLSLRDLHCPVCRADVDSTFLICPVCTTRLKQSCTNCQQPLEALWQVCPYCETPVESTGIDLPALEARPRRRRRSAE